MNELIEKAMTKNLVTIPWGTSVHAAEELMREKRIRHLPVIDEDGDVLGILSHRDVNSTISTQSTPVEMAMRAPVEFVHESVSLRSVTLKMLEKKISCLLVANDQGVAVGIVTTDDLLWYLAEILQREEQEQNGTLAVLKEKTLQTIGDLANRLANIGI